jgi:DNA-binding GntR family transcriptional regulator
MLDVRCNIEPVSSSVVPGAQVEHSSLRQQVRRILRTSIVTGTLEPGTLYSVGSFADQLGVSATPVREALADLAHLGLVEVMRNRGFVVPELADRDLDEILQLRLFLEVPAIEQITGRVPAAEIEACRERVEECKAAAAAGDLVLFLDADRDLHLRLAGVLGNQRLVDVLAQLRDQTRLYGLREIAAAGRLGASADEHETLLDAIEAGDAKRARSEIERHLRHTRGSWAGKLEP